jgi:hypothetical protein
MSEPELQLDPAIRTWVFLPIFMINFLIGYYAVLLSILNTIGLSVKTTLIIQLRSLSFVVNISFFSRHSFAFLFPLLKSSGLTVRDVLQPVFRIRMFSGLPGA